MNFADSEVVASILSEKGFGPTGNYQEADLVLLNTCSIREKAEQTVRNRLHVFRQVKEERPGMLIGVSTHSEGQLMDAADGPADYVAIGPVYATLSKQVPDPVVGLEGVRAARARTTKPLVAIGGITRANSAAVIGAGADSVAVISDLVPNPSLRVDEFLRNLA